MSRLRLSSRSEGTFNAIEWIKEGDGLLVSARTTRATWLIKRRKFSALLRISTRPKNSARLWNELTGLPRASMLLLGYSIEMFLKAGLARAYHGCREEMFDRDLRRRFGHDLCALAEEVDFPITQQDRTDLDTLKHHILAGARYPASPKPGQSYADAVNDLTTAIWGKVSFRRYCKLAAAIRRHVARIDSDSDNPAVFKSLNIDQDGYLSFRIGGHLRTRITYRPSSAMVTNGKTAPDDVRALLDPSYDKVLLHYWSSSLIVEDGWGNSSTATVVRQDA